MRNKCLFFIFNIFYITILVKNTEAKFLTNFDQIEECFIASFFNTTDIPTDCTGEPINIIRGICGKTCIDLENEPDGASMIVFCNNTLKVFPNFFCIDVGNTTIINIQFPFCIGGVNGNVELSIDLANCIDTTNSSETPPTIDNNDTTILLIVITVLTSLILLFLIIIGIYYISTKSKVYFAT